MTESPSDAEPGFIRWLVASDEELEASQLRHGSRRLGVSSAATCGRGDMVELYGRLRAVQHTPGAGAASGSAVEAELFDGSDSVTLIWLGRFTVGGVVAGAQLRVRGRVAICEGRKVLFNPAYTLEASQS